MAPLADGTVLLRDWSYDDLDCVEAASSDPRIPAGTTVPEHFTEQAGRAFIERQWSRVEAGEGISLAIHAVGRGHAVGLVSMMLRPQPGVIGLGYWIVPAARSEGYATSGRHARERVGDRRRGPGPDRGMGGADQRRVPGCVVGSWFRA